MVMLQKMPKELQAFLKQQKPAWPKDFLLAHQVAIKFSLPGTAIRSFTGCTHLRWATGCEVAINGSFKSALPSANVTPSQHLALLSEQLAYCRCTIADVGASRMRLKAYFVGRLLIPPC